MNFPCLGFKFLHTHTLVKTPHYSDYDDDDYHKQIVDSQNFLLRRDKCCMSY